MATKPHPKYTDNDFMPFGKYKGMQLANVPAEYFLEFLDGQTWLRTPLQEYIDSNREVLRQEVERKKRQTIKAR